MTVANSALQTTDEFQRLTDLLPAELQHCVTISFRRTVGLLPLIQSERYGKNYVIQIDVLHWQHFTADQRNLLLWHEVGRIQGHSIYTGKRQRAALAISLGCACLEIWTQNILLLSSVLVVAGLSGFQLYQKHQGEKSLREAAKADQSAIALAIHFGYQLSEAYESLSQALEALIIQTPQPQLQKKYRTRLQALKISATKAKINF